MGSGGNDDISLPILASDFVDSGESTWLVLVQCFELPSVSCLSRQTMQKGGAHMILLLC